MWRIPSSYGQKSREWRSLQAGWSKMPGVISHNGKVLINAILNLHHQTSHLIYFKVKQEQLMRKVDRVIDPSVFTGVNVSFDLLTNTGLGS